MSYDGVGPWWEHQEPGHEHTRACTPDTCNISGTDYQYLQAAWAEIDAMGLDADKPEPAPRPPCLGILTQSRREGKTHRAEVTLAMHKHAWVYNQADEAWHHPSGARVEARDLVDTENSSEVFWRALIKQLHADTHRKSHSSYTDGDD